MGDVVNMVLGASWVEEAGGRGSTAVVASRWILRRQAEGVCSPVVEG